MPQTISGRGMVLAMFGFGIVMTGLLWTYWELYTRPFRPLQVAINEAFPGSSPRVIGGEHKSHKNEFPATLRIVVYVDFNPEEAGDAQVKPYTSRLLALAAEHVDLSPYEQIQIHLVHRVPESATQQRAFTFPLNDGKPGESSQSDDGVP